MKRQFWLLVIALITASALALALTGCNIAPAAGGQEHDESGERINPADWPTPQPTPFQASPTPFPKITQAPTATPTPRPEDTSPTTLTSSTTMAGQGLTFSGDVGSLVEQVTELSGGFPPTAAAVVGADEVTVRQGPAESFSPVGSAKQDELAAVLGKNAAGDWWYVLTGSAVQGWLPADALEITFALTEAPVLPDDPTAQESTAISNPLAGLEAVAVALVTGKDGATVRQGPAASYPSSGSVEQGELAGVFGVNAARNWLYVFTISGVHGWLPGDTVRITGSLEGAPVLPADHLAVSVAQPQPASSLSAGTSADSAAGFQPLDLNKLEPATSARVDNDALNVRQGPGAAYEKLGALSRDDQVEVLALNKTKDWTLVKTPDGGYGWVSVDYLSVDGSLANAPHVISPAPDRSLTPGQVAPIFSTSPVSTVSVTAENPSSAQSGTATTQPEPASTSSPSAPKLSWASISPAQANRADVKLFRGPGTTYEPIVSLDNQETVSVLGLNQDEDWVLVKPSDDYKSPGWAPLQDLNVDGLLADAPRIITAWVDSNELAVLRGPGLFYEQTGSVAINTLVAVLGVNEGRNWALIQPIFSGGGGWIPLNFLTLAGYWSEVPVAPAPPLAPAEDSSTRQAAVPASATRPGKVVFQTSSGGDIMVINPDGTGLRRLTYGIDPVLSPDGKQVAFTRWTGEDGALWLINVDGGDERPVLGGTKQAKHPAWSPDGQQIVVNFQHEGRLDPKQVCEDLIELGDKRPDIPWNVDPDSIKVEIYDYKPFLCWTLPPDPHWGLRVASLADGSFEDVPSDAYAYGPEWDPANAWRIVSSGFNGLVQLDVNRNEQWALTDRREDHTPVFSPDGRYIAVAYNNNGYYDIYRLNSDGNGRVALTKTPLWVTAQPGQNKPWNNVSPAWSPDGSQIAFLTDRNGRWEVWVMNADGSNQRPMFPDEVNDQLQFAYDFVDERVLSWR